MALPALQAIELIQRKVLPTYGVSFGLPYPTGGYGGYPANVLGDYYPAQNPNFGSVGPNGLNLGLVNVNPLVSVQVAKTDYGEKVVKPLVNLHVTPNANLIQKVGDFFKRKPAEVHSTHYHHHDHYTGYEHHGYDHHDHHDHHSYPHYYGGSGPHFSVEMVPSTPIFEYHSGPSVPVSHHHHHEASPYENSFHSIYPGSAPDFGGYGEYSQHVERSANVSSEGSSRRGKQLTLGPLYNIPTPAPGEAAGSDRVTFPRDRRRRSLEDGVWAGAAPEEQVTMCDLASRVSLSPTA